MRTILYVVNRYKPNIEWPTIYKPLDITTKELPLFAPAIELI